MLKGTLLTDQIIADEIEVRRQFAITSAVPLANIAIQGDTGANSIVIYKNFDNTTTETIVICYDTSKKSYQLKYLDNDNTYQIKNV